MILKFIKILENLPKVLLEINMKNATIGMVLVVGAWVMTYFYAIMVTIHG